MSDVPMPRDLSEEAVAEWLNDLGLMDLHCDDVRPDNDAVRAVRALVEREVAKERASTREKVREAVAATVNATCQDGTLDETWDAIIARVMGDHPSNASGGHEPREGREEAPRG